MLCQSRRLRTYCRHWQAPFGRLPAPGAHCNHDCICWHDLAIHFHPCTKQFSTQQWSDSTSGESHGSAPLHLQRQAIYLQYSDFSFGRMSCWAWLHTFYMLLPLTASQPDTRHGADADHAACLLLCRRHKCGCQLRGVHLRCGVLRAHGLYIECEHSAHPRLSIAMCPDHAHFVCSAAHHHTCVLRTVPSTQSGVPATACRFAFVPEHHQEGECMCSMLLLCTRKLQMSAGEQQLTAAGLHWTCCSASRLAWLRAAGDRQGAHAPVPSVCTQLLR
jgi:hypothetical protein